MAVTVVAAAACLLNIAILTIFWIWVGFWMPEVRELAQHPRPMGHDEWLMYRGTDLVSEWEWYEANVLRRRGADPEKGCEEKKDR